MSRPDTQGSPRRPQGEPSEAAPASPDAPALQVAHLETDVRCSGEAAVNDDLDLYVFRHVYDIARKHQLSWESQETEIPGHSLYTLHEQVPGALSRATKELDSAFSALSKRCRSLGWKWLE